MIARLDQLRLELGHPDTFVLGIGDVPLLREWALLVGHAAVAVNAMSATDLTNLYHASATDANLTPGELQRIAADIVMRCIETLGNPITTPELDEYARRIVREELERIAPRPIDVTSERGIIQLPATVHYKTEQILRIAALGHPIMMVGPAGCGKTTIGEHVAQALQLPFYITSAINDTHELTGFIDGHGTYHSTPFRKAFECGGVWVADEIDAWDAPALLAANSALANGLCVFPDISNPLRRHPNFRMVATANTFGSGADRVYVGRNELDAASLDRFAMIKIDYDLTLERMFAMGHDRWLQHVWDVRKIVNEKKIRHVVSSRAIFMGGAALRAGLLWDDVNEIYLMKGISDADRRKIDL